MAEAAMYRIIDTIPEVWQERQAVREEAEAILEARRRRLGMHIVGSAKPSQPLLTETASLPLQVDALSTAHTVLAAADTHGPDSLKYLELRRGLVLDCQRLLAEWYRKKRPEYFPPVRHVFHEATEEFFSHGLSIKQMTQNALTPIPDNPEEEARRVNEHIEDATLQILRRSLGGVALGGGAAIRTISECTQKAIDDYQHDLRHNRPHSGYDGYVPEIEKQMVRDIRLDPNSNDRFEEQIGLPGTYINPEIVRMALERRGAKVAGMTKTELHGSQLLVHDDLLDFAACLDEVASEQWCVNIFMGEVVPANHPKNYATFRQEAMARQESLKDMAETVAEFVLDLASDNFDRRLAPAHVEAFVKKLLLDLAKQDGTVAEQMFDEKTRLGLAEVIRLEETGRLREAFELMQKVERAAPGGGYCGGASCGLTSVDTASSEGKELSKILRAKAGDKINKDSVRKCKCGSKTIVYAHNATKVNKACLTCGASSSEKSSVTASAAA